MDPDGDKKNKEIKGTKQSFTFFKRPIFNVGSFLQSFWVRCRSVFPNITDGKFMESELRFVLYCGIFLWLVHLLYQAIK